MLGSIMKGLLATVSLLSFALWASQTPRECKVVLTWSAPASSPVPVTGYNIYRAEIGSQTFTKLNPRPLATPTYTDDTVQCGSAHTYYVVSVDAQGHQSTPSETWSVPTPIQRTHISWFRQHRRRALLLLALLMFFAVLGLIAVWRRAARMDRPRASAGR
jgi:hypothetical protein